MLIFQKKKKILLSTSFPFTRFRASKQIQRKNSKHLSAIFINLSLFLPAHSTIEPKDNGVLLQPSLSERPRPGLRGLAPRHRLPRSPRLPLLRRRHVSSLHHQLLLLLLKNPQLQSQSHPHQTQNHNRHQRPLLSPLLPQNPSLPPLPQPLRQAHRRRPRRPYPRLDPLLHRLPRLLLLPRRPLAGPDAGPGERQAIRQELRGALPHLPRLLPVPDAAAAAGGGGEFDAVGGGEVLQRQVGDGGEASRSEAGFGSRCPVCYCNYTLLMQSSDSLLLCNQCQLHSDDLACFSSEVGSSKEICGIKSSEKITGKENTVGGPCDVHHNSWKKMKAVVLRGHSSSLDSNALNGV